MAYSEKPEVQGNGLPEVKSKSGKFGDFLTSTNLKNHFRKRIGLLLFVTAAVGVKAVIRDHGPVHTQSTAEGDQFSHPDSQTTHIINFIAGKEKVSPDDERGFWIEYIEYYCLSKNIPLPENYKKLGKEELIKKVESLGPGIFTFYDTKNLESAKEKMPTDHTKFDRYTYEKIWKIAEECGSPRVQWGTRKYSTSHSLENRSSYDVFTDTISIDPTAGKNLQEHLLAEYAHACQANNNSVRSTFMVVTTGLRLGVKRVLGKNFGDSYKEEYEIPGSYEYEAHKVIEPEFLKQIKNPADKKPLELKDLLAQVMKQLEESHYGTGDNGDEEIVIDDPIDLTAGDGFEDHANSAGNKCPGKIDDVISGNSGSKDGKDGSL